MYLARLAAAIFALNGLLPQSSTATSAELAYVASSSSATVSVIDVQAQTVLRTIAAGVGDHPQLAISPDGSTIYARSAHRLSLVDAASRRIVAELDLDEPTQFAPSPPGVAVSASDGRVYVASGSQVLIVPPQSGEAVTAVQAAGEVGTIALSADGRTLSFADSAVGLHVVDAETRATVATVPVTPTAIAVSPDGQQIWVTQRVPDLLTIYDRAAQRVVQRTLGSLGRPAFAPDGSLAYLVRPGGDVLVLDARSADVLARIPVPNMFEELIVTHDGRCAYAATSGGVALLDLVTREVVQAIALEPGTSPVGFALSTDDRWLYVADCRDGVCVVDTRTLGRAGTILRVGDAADIAVTPDGSRAFFASRSSSAGALDLATGNTIDRVSGPSFDTAPPSGSSTVAVTPDGGAAYILHGASFGLGLLSAVDTATLVETGTTDVGSPSDSIALSRDGATAFVTSAAADRIFAVDTATGAVARSLSVDGGPNAIALSPDGATAYVVRDGSADVAAVDLASGVAATFEFSTVGAAQEVVRDPSSARAFILAGVRVSTVDLTTGRLRPLVDLERRATAIAVSRDGATVYVIDSAYGVFEEDGNLRWIDSTTGQILGELHLSGGAPQDVALSADGSELLVSQGPGFESIMGRLIRIDAAAHTVRGWVSLGPSYPGRIWIPDEGARAYISGCRLGICVYDLALHQLEESLRIGGADLAFSADGRNAFVLSYDVPPTLSVVDTASGATTATVALSEPVSAIAVDPTGETAYAAGAESVAVIDVAAAVVDRSIPVPADMPVDLLAAADPARLVVAGRLGTAVIDLATDTALATFPSSFAPRRVVASSEGARVYVSGDPGLVFEIDPETRNTVRGIKVGERPEGLAFTSDGARLLVANRGDASVSVIRTQTGDVEATLPVGREPVAIAIAPAPPVAVGTATPTSSPTALTAPPTRTRQTRTPTVTRTPGTRTPTPTSSRTPLCPLCDDRPCGFALCEDGVTYSRAICTQSEEHTCGCVPIDCPTRTPTVTPTLPVAPETPCGPLSPSFSGALCGPGGEPCALLLDEPLRQPAYVFGIAIGPDQAPRLLFGDNIGVFHGFYGVRTADGTWRIEATPFAMATGSMALDSQGTVFVLAYDGEGGLGDHVSLWSRDAEGWHKRQQGVGGANFAADSLVSGGSCLFAGASLGADAIAAYGRWQEGWSFRAFGQPDPPIEPRPVLAVSPGGTPYVLFSELKPPSDYALRLADAHGDVASIVTLPFTGEQVSQRLAVSQDARGLDVIHVLAQNPYQTGAGFTRASGDEILYARRAADGSWQTRSLARGAALSWDPCGRLPDSFYDHCTYEVETLAPIAILTNGSDVRLLYVRQQLRHDEIPQCYGPVCPSWMPSGAPVPVVAELRIAVPTEDGFDTAVIASDFPTRGGSAALDAAGRIHLAVSDGLQSRYAVAVPRSQVTANPTPTSTPTLGHTPAGTPGLCVGDCRGTGSVAVSDLIVLINIALGHTQSYTCSLGIADDVQVTIGVLIQAVNHALNGCSG